MAKLLKLSCASGLGDDPLTSNILMYMPAGISRITPSLKGKPVDVCVEVTAEAANELNDQLRIFAERNLKPYFSIGDDSHASDAAAFWPEKFFWATRRDATGKMATGVWVQGEWSTKGRTAVEGKDFRAFSPTFFVDDLSTDSTNPARIICNNEANPNMGALINDPAFTNISPLWARNAKLESETSLSDAGASKTPGVHHGVTTTKNKVMDKNTESTQELQSRKERLELTVNALQGKDDAVSKAELRACRSEIREIDALISKAQTDETNRQLEANRKAQNESDAEWGVQQMVDQGQIPLRGSEDLKDRWREKFQADPALIELMCGAAPRGIVSTRKTVENGGSQITPHAGAIDAGGRARRAHDIEVGFDVGDAFKHYTQLVCANARINYIHAESKVEAYREKGAIALEAARFYKTVLAKNKDYWFTMPLGEIGKKIGLQARATKQPTAFQLQAGDYTDNSDPTNVLGVLSGTLVLQQTLPFFAYKYPELLNFYTDFSDTPGLYKQTETTRIVTQPAVQLYSTATDGTGRPKGWSTVSTAQTTDVSLTLTDYIAVPINMGQNLLASTTRRLFDEQSVLAVKAIAQYFVQMITNLINSATYNSYAVIGTNGVTATPIGATPTLVSAYQDFNMGVLDTVDAIFTNGKVPEEDRGIMLTPSYYSKLRGDPRLSFYYAASAGSLAGAADFVTEAKLPKLSGFAPYKAPYLPSTSPNTNSSNGPTNNSSAAQQSNIVGFAFQKAGAIVKSRLPQDFSTALGVMIPGSVTTITDPDTLISVMLVQYVNLTNNYAEWRPEVMLGVAAGDTRAGLVITSA